MRTGIHCGTIALVLMAGIGFAAAQTPDTPAPGIQPRVLTPGQNPQVPGGLDRIPGETLNPPLPNSAAAIRLTPTQKTAISAAIKADAGRVNPPTAFNAQIGASVPPAIELYTLPNDALAQVPEARILKYTMVAKQVVLVDPTTMRVVDVITQ